MPKNLGNAVLIASSATFTLLVFQVFAAAPPLPKPADRPQERSPQIANMHSSSHDYAQSNHRDFNLSNSGD